MIGPEFSFVKLVEQGIVWQFDHRSPFPTTLIARSLQPLLPEAISNGYCNLVTINHNPVFLL